LMKRFVRVDCRESLKKRWAKMVSRTKGKRSSKVPFNE